ncbi:MAG: glycine--tRNA ligase [Euryarchaeota archaeon]|nr:glycine--tRNA ligase [Euryarchaeota archaeon]OUW22658.1 MAG: glycine--tRNA ligase [Euryarchaeota archaeon TMED173]
MGIIMVDKQRMSRLTSLLRRRGIVLPSFELYGGVSGLVDYGPVGATIKRRVIDTWIEHWHSIPNIVEVDSPTITPEPVLVASGHVGEFNDKMSECRSCGSIFRSDHLLEGLHPSPDNLDGNELDRLISEHGIKCSRCGESDWKEAIPMNLMFKTSIGAMRGSRTAYMRPETAQGMFMLFPVLFRHFRQKMPFGAIQTGKGYRNEISPRQGMIRLREFNMAELEFFIDPELPPSTDLGKWQWEVCMIPDPEGEKAGEKNLKIKEAFETGIVKHPTVAWFLGMTAEFLEKVGIDLTKIRFRQHANSEMAHYASDCWDCELLGEHGWIEAVGIANRTCHDLESHQKKSGSKLLMGWREYDSPVREERDTLKPVGSIIGPEFREKAAEVSSALSELQEIPEIFPFELELSDGEKVVIAEKMVQRSSEKIVINGEYFTPHVIEPAFGIDRIIWHILDHNFLELEKEDESYTILSLNSSISPYDIAIFPLFDKDGMDDMAREIFSSIKSETGIMANLDTGGSIGRRYARADEIGIPWAATVDHQSLKDNTVTIRRRDDQKQIRVGVQSLIQSLSSNSTGDLF